MLKGNAVTCFFLYIEYIHCYNDNVTMYEVVILP